MFVLKNSEKEFYVKQQQEIIKKHLKHMKNDFPSSVEMQKNFLKLVTKEKEKKTKIIEKYLEYEESNVEDHGSVSRSMLQTPESKGIDLREIQENMKLLMENRKMNLSQEPRSQEKKLVKVPLIVPLSTYRKSQKISLPVIQKTSATGHTYSIHLLSDPCKVNDPLIKVYATIDALDSDLLENKEDISKIVENIKKKFNNRSSSLPNEQNRNFESLNNMNFEKEFNTPKEKPEYYSFRDLGFDNNTKINPRKWVKDRAKNYSNRIKNEFLPKKSEKKQIEMMLLREKQKKISLVPVQKLKIIH